MAQEYFIDNILIVRLFNFTDNSGVNGAEFALIADDCKLLSHTNAEGTAVFQDFADGEYTLTQTYMPSDYIFQPVNFGVLVQNGIVYINRQRRSCVNIPALFVGKTEVTQAFIDTHRLSVRVQTPYEVNLGGCEVTLTDSRNNKITEKTDCNGEACFDFLKAGSYKGEVAAASGLELDGSVFFIQIDKNGITWINGIAGNSIEINLIPIDTGPQATYFFAKDDKGMPLRGVPFGISSFRFEETVYSDQNGKVILEGLCQDDIITVTPGAYPGHAVPAPFIITFIRDSWYINSDPTKFSKIVYKKSSGAGIITKAFIWRDGGNLNNTRFDIGISFYANGKLKETKILNINDDVQNLSFASPKSGDYQIQIGEIPKGYTLIKSENSYIIRLSFVTAEVVSVLAENNLIIAKRKILLFYDSDFTIYPEKLGNCKNVTPKFYRESNITSDMKYVFIYS
ncbi:MAG: hypothetical protein LBR74_01505 [Eubacterium sp.]|jgi:hypothetical protein|nr:hypothetical protein [Eubacterium sp.]